MKKAIIYILLCTIFTSIGQVLLKFGALRIDSIISAFNLPLILGLGSYGIGFFLMLAAFKNGELSVLYPLLASAYIWVSLFSPLFFVGEEMNAMKYIGIFSILVAVSLLGFGSSRTKQQVKHHG